MVAKSIKPDYGPVPDDFDPDEIPGVHFVSKQEAREFFESEAMKTLGITGEEFVRRWEAGEWQPVPDDTEGRKIARLSMIIGLHDYANS